MLNPGDHHTETRNLFKKNPDIGVKSNQCSTCIGSSGIVAYGEEYNLESNERNAVITFSNVESTDIVGKDSGTNTLLYESFSLIGCLTM
jgi:hypothetical protein